MNPINIVDACIRTAKIFDGSVPKAVISGLNGVEANLDKICKFRDSKGLKSGEIVILGGLVGDNMATMARRLMEESFVFLPGRREYAVLQLIDAINRKDDGDINFYLMILAQDAPANDIIFNDEMKIIYDEVTRNITSDVVKWMDRVPPALVFESYNKDSKHWPEDGKPVIISACAIVSPYSRQGYDIIFIPDMIDIPNGQMIVSISWIPYLLHSDRIRKEVVRAQLEVQNVFPVLSGFVNVIGVNTTDPSVRPIPLSVISPVNWSGRERYKAL